MEGTAPVGVEDPVEGDGEEEKGQEVEDFVVDVEGEVEAGEAGVACEEEEEEEDSWVGRLEAGDGGDGGADGGRELGRAAACLPAKGSRILILKFWVVWIRLDIDTCL